MKFFRFILIALGTSFVFAKDVPWWYNKIPSGYYVASGSTYKEAEDKAYEESKNKHGHYNYVSWPIETSCQYSLGKNQYILLYKPIPQKTNINEPDFSVKSEGIDCEHPPIPFWAPLVPGLAQFYKGENKKKWFFRLGTFPFAALGIISYFVKEEYEKEIKNWNEKAKNSPTQMEKDKYKNKATSSEEYRDSWNNFLWGSLGFAFVFYVINVVDGYDLIGKNSQEYSSFRVVPAANLLANGELAPGFQVILDFNLLERRLK